MNSEYRTPLHRLLRRYIWNHCVEPERDSVLIVGAGETDVRLLRSAGFANVTGINVGGNHGYTPMDAERLDYPDNSFDIVFTHAVLHHCYSPHKALLEGTRVSRKHYIFLESHDSLLMKLATAFDLHPTYELTAVIDEGYASGGVANGPVPNHAYRWTRREVVKTVRSGFPHLRFDIDVKTYFYMAGHWPQFVLNSIPVIRQQGNHFFCAIRKLGLLPWIAEKDGDFVLAEAYRK